MYTEGTTFRPVQAVPTSLYVSAVERMNARRFEQPKSPLDKIGGSPGLRRLGKQTAQMATAPQNWQRTANGSEKRWKTKFGEPLESNFR